MSPELRVPGGAATARFEFGIAVPPGSANHPVPSPLKIDLDPVYLEKIYADALNAPAGI